MSSMTTVDRMDFNIPAKYRMIQDTVHESCEEEIAPIAQDIKDERWFPVEIFDQLTELDVMGVPIDKAYGGLDDDQLMYALVVEELGCVSGGIGLSYAARVSLVPKPIGSFGTDEQKERWLTPLAAGEHLDGWALTELGSGSNTSDMDAVAGWDDDGYVTDGTKQLITNANVAGSVLVKAVTDSGVGYDGTSASIVDSENDNGSEATTEWDKMGLNSSPTRELPLDDCWVPEDRLFSEEGGSWEQTMKAFDDGRISITAFPVGLAEGAYGHVKSYAQEREQFDRPISKFDAIRDKLVLTHRKAECVRFLTYKVATRYDAGKWVSRESVLAKLDASEAAREIAENAVQMLGGYDYTTNSVPQRFHRDAKLMEVGKGASEVQYLIVDHELGL